MKTTEVDHRGEFKVGDRVIVVMEDGLRYHQRQENVALVDRIRCLE